MTKRLLAFAATALTLAACHRAVLTGSPAPGTVTPSASTMQNNTLSDADRAAGWVSLFDGQSLANWRGYKMDTLPTGWSARDGLMVKTGESDDIVSRKTYRNFELELDWRIATGGNAGIFYRGTEEYDHIYWSAPEYQLLDDANHPDGKNRLTSAAADYALYPSPAGIVTPAGEWNHTRIVVNGNHVEHWLNGHLMVSYELLSPDWEAKVAASKFKDWPHYGRSPSGLIGLQGDHPGELALRNIRIRELP